VFCHGFGGVPVSQYLDMIASAAPIQCQIIATLARYYPLVMADMGGNNTWGNATVQSRITSAITWLQSSSGGGAKTGKAVLIGVSEGGVSAFNYAKNNAASVAGLAGLLSACDMDDIRNANRGGGLLRASIETAYGVGAWTSNNTPPLPAQANPAVYFTGTGSVPIRYYYSTGDTIALPSTVTALATNVGSTMTLIQSGNLDHSDASLGNISMDDLLSWLATVG
jgi:pimeloyl-ACP methyl ester carboxylesterase